MKKDKHLNKIVETLEEASFKDGKLVENQVTKSIKILKSLSKSQAIFALTEYLKQIKRKERQFTMYIESAIPLSSNQVKKMREIVEKRKKISKVLVNINPEILGGFKLKIGDEIWDETILGKINQVKEVISGRSSSSD